MTRVTRVLLMTVVCSAVGIASAQAQTCMGQTPTEVGQLRAGAQANFASGTHGVGGGVAKQFNSFFAGGGAMVEGVSFLDSSSKGFYGSAGTERPLGAEKKYFLCPLVQVFMLWGPHPAPDTDTSTFLINLGGMVGWEATKTGNTRIVPTAGFSINFAHSKWSGGGFDFTDNETIASLQGGVGLIFNEKMSLVPMIIIDLNADEIEPTFAAIFSIKLGKK